MKINISSNDKFIEYTVTDIQELDRPDYLKQFFPSQVGSVSFIGLPFGEEVVVIETPVGKNVLHYLAAGTILNEASGYTKSTFTDNNDLYESLKNIL